MGELLLDIISRQIFIDLFSISYYKDAEKTAEAIDSEGWHHTGDVGMWLPNGTLRIIDRRKHIFKLSQGEYIVPEKIENIYTLSQYVNQVYVYGESLKVGYITLDGVELVVFRSISVNIVYRTYQRISNTFPI